MRLFIHNKSWNVNPMLIAEDYDHVIDHIWSTSTSVKDLEKDFHSEDVKICKLDPGGMYNMKILHKQFQINNQKFDIQLSRIEEVLHCMSYGKERVPGYIRFPNWRCVIILPKDSFNKLKEKLEKLEKSDEALHAEIQDRSVRDDLHGKGFIT